MLLKDFEKWLDNLKNFYSDNSTIYNSPEFDIYIAELKSNILSYKIKKNIKEKFEDTLLYIYAYVNLKYCVKYENQPEIPDLIKDDKVTNLFGLFYYELSESYKDYFIIDDTTNTVIKTEKYDLLLEDIKNLDKTDIDKNDKFVSDFSKKTKKKILYMTLSQPETYGYSINPKNHILHAMDGELLVNEYNWKIYGLNSENSDD